MISRSFAPFSPSVKTRHDQSTFYVESNGIPDHELMTGIVAWQQQVPLPQPYFGHNAWQFPLFPQPAATPKSAKTGFFRGAIAIAANGVPIFNPIKNDGRTDTLLAGELDKFGGHGGRADDYHYHVAPLHLIARLGNNVPIAYALDGYPIFGLTCSNGTNPTDLDTLNGHTTPDRGYHYHATRSYPYLNGGFHGVVQEAGGQVDPQPQAQPIRPSLPPLRGAKITAFKKTGDSSYSLTYEMGGQLYRVDYSVADAETTFTFIDPDGAKRTERYQNRTPARGGKSSSKQAGARKPWIYEHFEELDTDHDGNLTLAELLAESNKAFMLVAGEADRIKVADLNSMRPAKAVLGGYLKQHADEFDAGHDGFVSRQEVINEMTSLFHKSDPNHDHMISREEAG